MPRAFWPAGQATSCVLGGSWRSVAFVSMGHHTERECGLGEERRAQEWLVRGEAKGRMKAIAVAIRQTIRYHERLATDFVMGVASSSQKFHQWRLWMAWG